MSEMTGSIYGSNLDRMTDIMNTFMSRIEDARKKIEVKTGMDPVEHCLCRIKSEESMREKCRRNSLPENEHSALIEIHDAIGIRVVCAFVDDVYSMRDHITTFDGIKIFEEKDYIKSAKPNGYRSYHMILKTDDGFFVEVQLRTVSMDTWASLEHHMKYKKNISGNEELISKELKRCADELASTDVSMQAIRNLINS
ncbi:MAG: GTP pyrophosphokinase family protein [Clostridia bacterium]|nr:GTP pyrophosphokinase family protein [Clostridia bacterium]